VVAGVLLTGWVVGGPGAPALAGPPSPASSVAAVSHRAGAIASGDPRAVRLRPRELGLPRGSLSGGASAVSDSGRYVAGSATFDNFGQVSHAVLWRDGRMRDLGRLGGRDVEAVDVNDRGQVLAGTSLRTPGALRAFVWQRGRTWDVGTLGGDTLAVAINNRGQVLAVSSTPQFVQHAVLWQAGRLVDLGLLPGGRGAFAYDLNDRGDVAGWAVDAEGVYQLVVWPRGRPGPVPLGVAQSLPTAVNEHGAVALTTVDNHAAVWWRGRLRAETPVTAFATDLNDRGVVVGSAQPVAGAGYQGMIWRHGRVSLLYRPPGYDHTSALKLNNRNQVLGFASTDDFSRYQSLVWEGRRTVLLAPLTGDESAAAADDISRRGQVPGSSTTRLADGSIVNRAVLWTVR
jgi:probable HAF family extracellular repeat protein